MASMVGRERVESWRSRTGTGGYILLDSALVKVTVRKGYPIDVRSDNRG